MLRKAFTPDRKQTFMKGLKQCLLFPKFNCGCGLVTLALALAWPARGADPVLIGQWPGWPRGAPYAVAVSGNYAYVAAKNAGLQVIDVSNPANPQRVGGYDTSGSALGVAVSGNYAYVADGQWGVMILGPRPRITSITWAAGTATVYYTNTIPGTAYTLECRTNLTAGNWQPVGTQPAPGNSASQTDTGAGGDQRYYRVCYRP